MRAEGTNPCSKIERYRENRRERFLSADELGRLGATLRRAESEGLPWKAGPGRPSSKDGLAKPENRCRLYPTRDTMRLDDMDGTAKSNAADDIAAANVTHINRYPVSAVPFLAAMWPRKR
jgi:hypothetical protein